MLWQIFIPISLIAITVQAPSIKLKAISHLALTEGWLQRGKGEPGYIRVSATKIRQSKLEKLLLIKENEISQVKEFSAFCVWENTRVWAH